MEASHRARRAFALSFALIGLATLFSAGAGAAMGTAPSAAGIMAERHPVGGGQLNPVGGGQLNAAGVIVHLTRRVPPPPAMPGASFLLADMDTGQILAARSPHAPRLPASTLKALAALTLIPRLDANLKIMVKPQDVRVEGSHLGILAGSAYSAGTLLQGMLTASGNDAAYALARANHGVAATLRQMNATAAHLGAFDTVVKDPSGLDKAGQKSSAYDLALIGRAAMKLPDFRRYVLAKKASVPLSRTPAGKRIAGYAVGSHNKLLFNYPGAIGIKTGYTIAAKFTFIGAATRGAKTYLMTEMGSPQGSWRPSAALLDWAFAHGSKVTPIGRLVDPGEATSSTLSAHRPPASKPTAASALPLPTSSLRQSVSHALPTWAGVAAGIAALALVAGWTMHRRAIRRH
ncbi:MAG: hypothetical protein QOE58_1566 [Actinomycetota bacterium]|jgi:D-alanyl-D-alanine carboxypeptidase (penicillin-binding protein 5/6)|nr:hypothetical protein [Actinomycetota bacterium]